MEIIAFILGSIGCCVTIFSLIMVNPWLASAFCGMIVMCLGLLIGHASIIYKDKKKNS